MKTTEDFETYIREELEVLVQNIHDMMESRGEPSVIQRFAHTVMPINL